MSRDDLRTDGGLSITAEEFERLKQANSSTPPEQRQRCPECGGADPVRKSNRGNQTQKPGQYRCRRPGCYAHFDEPVTGYESAEAVVEDQEETRELVTDGGQDAEELATRLIELRDEFEDIGEHLEALGLRDAGMLVDILDDQAEICLRLAQAIEIRKEFDAQDHKLGDDQILTDGGRALPEVGTRTDDGVHVGLYVRDQTGRWHVTTAYDGYQYATACQVTLLHRADQVNEVAMEAGDVGGIICRACSDVVGIELGEPELLTDGGTVQACPECETTEIHCRTGRIDPEKAGTWHCPYCGADFDEPERRPARSHGNETLPGGTLAARLAGMEADDLVTDGGRIYYCNWCGEHVQSSNGIDCPQCGREVELV